MGDEIPPDALLIDGIEPVVSRHFIASASGRGEDLIEEADEVGRSEFLDRDIDGIEGRNDPLAHGQEVIGRKARTVTYPDCQQHAKAPHKERAIAGKRGPCSIAQLVDAVAGERLENPRSLVARQRPRLQFLGNARARIVRDRELGAGQKNVGEERPDHVIDPVVCTDKRGELDDETLRADLMKDTLLLIERAISEEM